MLKNCKSYSHFFSKKFQHICISLDINFNKSLTNDIVSFEQLGPDLCLCCLGIHYERLFLYMMQLIKIETCVSFPFCLNFIVLATPSKMSLQSVYGEWRLQRVKLASMAQLDAPSNWRPGRGFNPRWGWQHSFVEIDHEIFSTVILSLPLRWSGGAKVSCISRHWGVQLISAYSWARPAILVAGKGRGGMFLFLPFLHFHSRSSFFPVPLFRLFYCLFYLFSPFLWETTQNDPQGLTCR